MAQELPEASRSTCIQRAPPRCCLTRRRPTTSTPSSTWCWPTPAVENNDMREFLYRDRTEPGRLLQGDVRAGPGQAGPQGQARHDPPEHQPVPGEGQREPDRLPQAARGQLLVVLVRLGRRGRRLLPQAAEQDRPQGRDRPAAGQVPDQQPQARQLLEQHARHGHRHRGAGRLHPRPAARTSRT